MAAHIVVEGPGRRRHRVTQYPGSSVPSLIHILSPLTCSPVGAHNVLHTPPHLPHPLAKARAPLHVAGVAAPYPREPGSHLKASAALQGGQACQFMYISTSTLCSFRRSKLQGSGMDSVDTFKGQTPVQGGRNRPRHGSYHLYHCFVGKAPGSDVKHTFYESRWKWCLPDGTCFISSLS